jgi:hypothetical protein
MDQDFVRREMPRQRFENCHRRRPRGVEQKHYILGHHLVAFLDVLGQREQFRKLRLPETPDEETHAKEVIKNTAGYVLGWRQLFQTQFEMFEKARRWTPTRRSLFGRILLGSRTLSSRQFRRAMMVPVSFVS